MSPGFSGAVVTVVSTEMEASILRGLLERSGIRCVFRKTDFAAGSGYGAPHAGPLELVVDEDDLDRARELLGRRAR